MSNHTVTIQIGNTDDKLGQVEWAAYVLGMKTNILPYVVQVHFFGAPANWERWQNAAWVVEVSESNVPVLKKSVESIRKVFRQESVAWTEGTTELI